MIIRAKAAVADKNGSFTLEEIEVHPPQAGEVRVALKASGICHTDHDSLNWGFISKTISLKSLPLPDKTTILKYANP